MTLGFFPTPYPDECLYSILCRYFVRCGGAGYEKMSKLFFGARINLFATIYLPIKSERIDYWISPESGITRTDIFVNHTMCPYFSIKYTPELRTEIMKIINGETPTPRFDRTMMYSSMYSWLKYLRYCPLCVSEDIVEYGETYWHRKHQLLGSYYCTKHQIRLANSHISSKLANFGFYPASNGALGDNTYAIADIVDDYKDKCLKISRESEWLIENGWSVNWRDNGRHKYLNFFRDSKMASVHGTKIYPDYLSNAVNDYWGSEFLNALFAETRIHPKWLSRGVYAGKNIMGRYLPLQHILLMCVAKDSVENFVSNELSENPFGKAPYMCENLICEHYHAPSAVCMEIRYGNVEAIGFFHCPVCGMKYKKAKGRRAKGRIIVLDYGHLWINELIRCNQDKNISNSKTAEILKCGITTIKRHKKKLGIGGGVECTVETKG